MKPRSLSLAKPDQPRKERRNLVVSIKITNAEADRIRALHDRLPMASAITQSGIIRELLRRGLEQVERELGPADVKAPA